MYDAINATYDNQDRIKTYGSNSYIFTKNGSLSSKTNGSDVTTYEYDEFGSLRSVILPDSTEIEYVIDPAGRRIGKKVDETLVQGFLYEGIRPVVELDGSGNVVSRFVYGTRANVPDFMIQDGVTYRIITDIRGSVRLVVNTSTGTIVQQIDYDTFGNILSDDNPGFQPFGFAGGLYDPDTGLTRFGARDYDPEIGRWTSKDPILFEGGDTNLYVYCGNDAVNLIDPYGLFGLEDVSNFFAGFGDYFTPLGGVLGIVFDLPSATEAIRQLLGINDVVDDCSGSYNGGQWAGFAFESALIGLGTSGVGASIRFTGLKKNNWFGIANAGTSRQFFQIGRHNLSIKELTFTLNRRFAGKLRYTNLTHIGIGKYRIPINPIVHIRNWLGWY